MLSPAALSHIDTLLTPGCEALGIRTPAHLGIALLTSRTLSATERGVVRALYNARRDNDGAAARLASAAALAVADGSLTVPS